MWQVKEETYKCMPYKTYDAIVQQLWTPLWQKVRDQVRDKIEDKAFHVI